MFKLNYKRVLGICLILILTLTIVGCSNKDEGLVARVDGEGITEEEFNTEFQVYKNISEQQMGEGALEQINEETGKTREEELKEDIIEMLIMERLIAKEASKANIEVTSEEIKEVLDQYITMMGGEEEFEESLQNSQITREFLEENLKKDMLISKHRENFLNNTTIDEEEAEKFFEDNKEDLIVVRASHILVKTEEEGQKVLERLNNGEDFAKLAEELSADKASGLMGGDLGYFGKGNYIAEFEEAAFALNPGETSDLVKTEVGYHIIRLEDKKDTFESLKEDIINYLKDQKYYEKLQEIRENAKVKIFL